MKKLYCFISLLTCVMFVPGLRSGASAQDLYEIFRNPAQEYRPFVRWWWNGDKVNAREILRELDLMKEAGIGGVEINPIAFPTYADSLDYKSLVWLSPEWVEMVKVAAEGCRERGMTADIIVGSGWPYGGEFLTRQQQLQMLTLETIDVKQGKFTVTRDDILNRVNPRIHSNYDDPVKELMYLRLMPAKIDSFTPGENYDNLVGNDVIEIDVPAGEYVLYCLVRMTGYMKVIHGAPGAKGPVLNHFNESALNAFWNRMSDALNGSMGKMGNGLRAAFTDSFELEGANWDDKMLEEFEKRRGYSLSPYLPYIIFKVGEMGNPVDEKYGSEFSQQLTAQVIDRVRNDFDLTMREFFHETFTLNYNKWCHANGIKSRVQAYGRGLHPIESSMFIDIPECETWMGNRSGEVFPENQHWVGRAYSMVNKFVASGSLLSGNRRVSCEEITNTEQVFNASLEQLKIGGDMSNLSGVNRSIFHGFNYSPPDAPFPGWMRYGAYINENNTWWPYFRLWTDYKARLSAIFSNSIQQADVAILHPLEDMWSKLGAQRDPFPTHRYPDYAHNLWEAVHQSGNGCDFVTDRIITGSKIGSGQMTYGDRSYKTLLLMEVESMHPEAAENLERFVAAGGKVVCIGKEPHQSVGLYNWEDNDRRVREAIARAKSQYPDRFVYTDAPGSAPILEWYGRVQERFDITPYVEFSNPDKFVSQNYYKSDDRDIFFISNYNIAEGHDTRAVFNINGADGKTAWIWDPETGERRKLAGEKGALDIRMGPAQTMLIVFENGGKGPDYVPLTRGANPVATLGGEWQVTLRHHVEDKTIERTFPELIDLSQQTDEQLKYFAGVIEYRQQVKLDNAAAVTVLDAGQTLNGITEVIVNGRSAGVKWYGDRLFDVKGMLKKGKNEVVVKVTTTLGNYCKSLDIPATQVWTRRQDYKPMGLMGPVVLY